MWSYKSDCEEYTPRMDLTDYVIMGITMLAAMAGIAMLWLYCV